METIGQLIKDEMKAQERTVTWLARKLGVDRSNVYRLFLKKSIDTDLLARLCVVLNKDFFAILSQRFHDRYNQHQ